MVDKAYASVTVYTLEGKTISGIRVSQDDKEIVLRNLAEPKPIKIKISDIEEDGIEVSKKSLMPAGLAKTLKNRQEFNDLMRYVLETRQ